MIRTKDLRYRIGDLVILDQFTADVHGGRITSLVGPSGSGKTTALNMLGLLLPPTAGCIEINGIRATDWSDRQRRSFWKTQAAFIYQDSGVIDDRTVAFNVTLRAGQMRQGEVRERVSLILEQVGLAGREDDMARVLSGGEKQRLGIARALFKKASWVFADEPTASLDEANKKNVVGLLSKMAKSGTGVVTATHDDFLIANSDDIIQISG